MELIEILLPPFIVGLLIVLTHIPLGMEVIKRKILFLDLAIAQLAGFGYLFAESIHIENHIVAESVAFCFALGGSFLFRFLEKKHTEHLEAFIGLSYVFSAVATLLLISNHPHGAEHIKEILSGDMLYATWDSILFHAPIYIGIILALNFYKKSNTGILFYILFSLAVTSSVQLVGIFFVFAVLVGPALAVSILNKNISYGYFLGILSLVTGLGISFQFDQPATTITVFLIILLSILSIMFLKKNNLQTK